MTLITGEMWDIEDNLIIPSAIENIFSGLDPALGAFYYDPSRSDRVFADTAGTVPALPLDTVALIWDNARATPADLSQPTSNLRPRRVGTPTQFGSEIAKNGTFATDTLWTKGAGWTITGGVAVATAATGALSQSTAAAIIGRQYQITYTIAGLTAGSITPSIGGVSGKTRTANGTYTDMIKAASAAVLSFVTSTTTATLDDVSVREITAWGAPWWLEFDGVDDYMDSPDGPASIEFATSSFTIGHRVMIQLSDPHSSILGKRGSGPSGTNPGWGTRVNVSGQLVLEYDFTGNTSSTVFTAMGQTASSLVPATLIYTFNASTGTFTGRINGVNMAPVSVPSGNIAGMQPLRMGAAANASVNFVNGRIGRAFGIGRMVTESELSTFETWLAAGG